MIGPIPIENINFNRTDDTSDDDDNDDNTNTNTTPLNTTNTVNTVNTVNNMPLSNRELWIEHERRQRTIRFLMMFLMMLILMDGEQQANNEEMMRKKNQLHLRRGHGHHGTSGVVNGTGNVDAKTNAAGNSLFDDYGNKNNTPDNELIAGMLYVGLKLMFPC